MRAEETEVGVAAATETEIAWMKLQRTGGAKEEEVVWSPRERCQSQ